MSLIVSISGVRGLVGETLTAGVVLQFAQAFATVMNGGRLALGRDTRPSGEMYAAAAAAGLTASGAAVTDLGVVMTPTIGRAIGQGDFEGGLMITASHNPQPWNGLKFLNHEGLAPDPALVERISDVRARGAYRFINADFEPLQHDDSVGSAHVRAVREALEVDPAPLRGTKVVLDSVNGAGCLYSPELLAELGCEVIHVNGEPSGLFAHPPEPLRENVTETCRAVVDNGAAIGFVQDPDADRLALIDERGEFVGEEYTLALAVKSVLSRRKGPVAANLSTSRMIDDVAAEYGVRTIRTPVGESHVARALKQEGGVIGGEGNGGVIDPRISWIRDSLSAMSLILQLMADTGMRLSELVETVPAYAIVKDKMECTPTRAAEAIESVARVFRGERLNRADGVRIDFDQGWVHLRASNTEPIVRVLAEARDADVARQLIARVREAAKL